MSRAPRWTGLVYRNNNVSADVDFKHILFWQTGKWETVRLTATLPATKRGKQMTVELKGRKSDKSDVLIQRIAGCNGEGMYFYHY
jgi:hypothetical protein